MMRGSLHRSGGYSQLNRNDRRHKHIILFAPLEHLNNLMRHGHGVRIVLELRSLRLLRAFRQVNTFDVNKHLGTQALGRFSVAQQCFPHQATRKEGGISPLQKTPLHTLHKFSSANFHLVTSH
jgi:hypothetical protein